MKLGLIVHFFDFRNDVRQWIEELQKDHELVLFVRPQDKETIGAMLNSSLEIRTIEERKNNIWNRFWELAFRFLGRLPESRQNYYLMEAFRISIINSVQKAAAAIRLLNFSMALPRVLPYDFFIRQLSIRKKTDISGIGQFLCFTELSDNYFISRLLKEGHAPLVYVYSWDHPCKHTRFSKRLQYLVWHPGLADDLIQLQHVPAGQIRVWGATQMAYVHRWLQNKNQFSSPYPFDYLYFGCAIGVPQLVEAELEMVRLVAMDLAEIAPHWKLVVRPYPVMKDWGPYEALREIPNLLLDDGFRAKKSENIAVNEDFIMEKFVKIQHAKAFLHLGTTLGIEACYTDAPSVLLDLEEYSRPDEVLSLHHFIHQFQNDKYLNHRDFPNVIRSKTALKQLINRLLANDPALKLYNQKVAADLKPKSFRELTDDFNQIIQSS